MSVTNIDKSAITNAYYNVISSLQNLRAVVISEGAKAFVNGDTNDIKELCGLIEAMSDVKRKVDKLSEPMEKYVSEYAEEQTAKPTSRKRVSGTKNNSCKTNTKENKSIKKAKNALYADSVEFNEDLNNAENPTIIKSMVKFPVELTLKSDYADARCRVISNKKTTLLKDSLIADNEKPTIRLANHDKRELLIKDNVLRRIERRGQAFLKLCEDVTFDTPTMAAGIVLGRRVMNGDKLWKGPDGTNLDTMMATGIDKTKEEKAEDKNGKQEL